MSRARIVFTTLALLLLTGLLIAVWAGIRYTATPQYSLGNLLAAINAGDWPTVQLYADTQAISDDAAAIVVKRQTDKIPFDLGGVGEKLEGAAEQAAANVIEQRMRAAVESRHGVTGFRQRLGAQAYVRRAKRVLVDGDKALVTIDVRISGRDREADLRMQREGRRWRVVAVENLSELLAQ